MLACEGGEMMTRVFGSSAEPPAASLASTGKFVCWPCFAVKWSATGVGAILGAVVVVVTAGLVVVGAGRVVVGAALVGVVVGGVGRVVGGTTEARDALVVVVATEPNVSALVPAPPDVVDCDPVASPLAWVVD